MNEINISALFGSRLKALRESNSQRQDDVAALFNMNKSAVSQWESGRLPHPTIIAKLADHFRVTTDYLLGRTDSKDGMMNDERIAEILLKLKKEMTPQREANLQKLMILQADPNAPEAIADVDRLVDLGFNPENIDLYIRMAKLLGDKKVIE